MVRDLIALEARVFDLLVVGGGIVGASAARDAALRGLSVALVERADFASGTSANSLKLVHGGLRYLQRLELGAMRESIRERSTWLRIAPHLVHPVGFLLPLHGRGVERQPVLRAALALNDLLSADRNRSLPPERAIPPGRALSAGECVGLIPDLPAKGLVGGVMFYDAQMYSAERLVLAVVEGAAEAGAVVANYVECRGARQGESGTAVAQCLDVHGGTPLEIRARMVVNAAGSSAFDLRRELGTEDWPALRYSVAMNLVLDDRGYRSAFAISAGGPGVRGANKRLFVVPWRGRTLVGTAHYPILDPASEPPDPETYLRLFLEEVNLVWPGSPISRADVLRFHFGLLPLRSDAPPDRVALLRRGKIIEDRSPVLTVASVKFTTARRLAERAVDRVVARLGRDTARSTSHLVPLPGAPAEPFGAFAASVARARPDLDPDVLDHLLRSYGTRFARVAPGPERPVRRVTPESSVLVEQFEYGVREEMAMRAEDLVERRTELGPTATAVEQALPRAAQFTTSEPATNPGPDPDCAMRESRRSP